MATTISSHLYYRVPFGESGQGYLRAALKNESILRIFRFENIHAAAHRGRASVENAEIVSQNIDIVTGMTVDGEIIAVAGKTETMLVKSGYEEPACAAPQAPPTDSSDGSPTGSLLGEEEKILLRELAYLADIRRLFALDGADRFVFDRRVMPLIKHAGTYGSAYRALQNHQTLAQKSDNIDIYELLRSLSAKELDIILKAFAPVEEALAELGQALAAWERSAQAFTGLRVIGGEPQVRAEIVSPTAAPSTYQVRVARLAQAHTVESEIALPSALTLGQAFDNDGRPLLARSEYTFYLAGIAVKAYASDSLATLADRINWGEDRNRNFVLDRGSAYYPDEDADGNSRLDGGTIAHGVRASYIGNRLRLTNERVGAIEINDPDGLLAALGLLAEDRDGRIIFPREIAQPAAAMVECNGRLLLRQENTVSDAIPGVRLDLLTPSENPVALRVEKHLPSLAADLRQLVDRYNAAIEALNRALSPLLDGSLRAQRHANLAYQAISAEVEHAVKEQSSAGDRAPGEVLAFDRGQPLAFHEAQIENALRRLAARLQPLGLESARSPATVYNAADAPPIGSENDNTLHFHGEQLRAALTARWAALRDFFRLPGEGLVPRLAASVRDATDPRRGRLAFDRYRLSALAGANLGVDLTQAIRRYHEASLHSMMLNAGMQALAPTRAMG